MKYIKFADYIAKQFRRLEKENKETDRVQSNIFASYALEAESYNMDIISFQMLNHMSEKEWVKTVDKYIDLSNNLHPELCIYLDDKYEEVKGNEFSELEIFNIIKDAHGVSYQRKFKDLRNLINVTKNKETKSKIEEYIKNKVTYLKNVDQFLRNPDFEFQGIGGRQKTHGFKEYLEVYFGDNTYEIRAIRNQDLYLDNAKKDNLIGTVIVKETKIIEININDNVKLEFDRA